METSNSLDDLLTVEDAARIAGRTQQNVRHAIKTGAIRAIRTKAARGPYRWLIRKSEVERAWPKELRGVPGKPRAKTDLRARFNILRLRQMDTEDEYIRDLAAAADLIDEQMRKLGLK